MLWLTADDADVSTAWRYTTSVGNGTWWFVSTAAATAVTAL